ncbi:hypothetical protein SAMN04488063_0908 [Halopelagius inordinatus]|uniref:Probable membrane transporter protein n=1 Tax=Halopelagius inordinatus TaxID=553467 RepID=A0A1I2N0Z7_9EURY|nr:sulfite exporter TauE/SafE family protein [Halopelagius inordinatus]SFF95367.1 hypothetical protein SAMN04488063_0908 [Halopelagius inordinatus]
MIPGVSTVLLAGLVCIALVAGVGITTLGPGGIFVTVALYALTPLPSATVAGTAHATFVATGIVGTLVYARSGELVGEDGRGMAAILSAASVVGALAGAYLNSFLSRDLFGVLLGVVASLTGCLLLYRQRRELEPVVTLDPASRRGQGALGVLGFVLGVASGLVGVGGPVLAVPALVVLGVPMLLALGVAQVQSIFIAAFAAAGYVAQGAVSLPLVVLLGVPQVVGVVAGWAIAHRIDPGRLKVALGVVLVGVGVYLVA